jgi:CubicO group peptidase (beta-lactamase class C family)
MKHRLKFIVLPVLAVFIAALVWFGSPIYGFLSEQYEVARLPFGWVRLPKQAPHHQHLSDPRYAAASQASLDAIESRRKKLNLPSISAAVAINGALVWTGSAGWANVERDVPATYLTAYRIGSTSKAVTATGLARLVAFGTIELNEPISDYIPDLPNPEWRSLTPKQLASHTAGIPEYGDNTGDLVGLYESTALQTHFTNPYAALSVFDGTELLFKPGTDFHYTSYDFVLLSAVMAAAAKKPFMSLMAKKVFRPLGLSSIEPDRRPLEGRHVAVSYQTKGDRVKPWRNVDLSVKLAAGGLVATPSDLAVLGVSWLNENFIPASIQKEFWTPVKLSNGQVNKQNYALGWRRTTVKINGLGSVRHMNHGGISKGSQCWLMVLPQENMAIAIATNARTEQFFEFASVYREIVRAFVPMERYLSSKRQTSKQGGEESASFKNSDMGDPSAQEPNKALNLTALPAGAGKVPSALRAPATG